MPPQSSAPQSLEDALLSLASAIEPDGGMPGRSTGERASVTVAALLAFLAHGHTPWSGAFRSHVARMVAFLESLRGLDAGKCKLVDQALIAARNGPAPSGDWLRLAQTGGENWKAIGKALAG